MGLFSFLGIGKNDKRNNVEKVDSQVYDEKVISELDSNLAKLSQMIKDVFEIINDNKEDLNFIKNKLSEQLIPEVEGIVARNKSILENQRDCLDLDEMEIININTFNENCIEIVSTIKNTDNVKESMNYILKLQIANHKILTTIDDLRVA